MRYRRKTRDEHYFDPGPKRILALDGGGLRGSFTLGLLAEMEDFLRERNEGGADFRLADYFDLMAGTSTGAIIAGCLSLGMSVDETYRYYRDMGEEVFQELKGTGAGMLRPRFDPNKLSEYLRDAVGSDTRLGDDKIRTGLLVVTKRLDTHSVWALGNNPRGQYFSAPEGATWVPNSEYPLWRLLRASSAAPTYFAPKSFTIAPDEEGLFVDGGVGPFNDPSLQALMYTTMSGYRVGWAQGADNLLMISLGTGFHADPSAGLPDSKILDKMSAREFLASFLSLLHDNQTLVRELMQWMSRSPTATPIDSEVGDLSGDLLGPEPLLSYARYDIDLTPSAIAPVLADLDIPATPEQIDSLWQMDRPANVVVLYELGRAVGRDRLADAHFPESFDLEAAPA